MQSCDLYRFPMILGFLQQRAEEILLHDNNAGRREKKHVSNQDGRRQASSIIAWKMEVRKPVSIHLMGLPHEPPPEMSSSVASDGIRLP